MSEVVSQLDRAAAAYWRRLAQSGGAANASAALARAQQLTVEARAEARIPDRAQRPTLDQVEITAAAVAVGDKMAAVSEPASHPAIPFDPGRVEALLKTISADQKSILTTLGLVLDGFASHTVLLKELTKLASDDPGPSPLADSLDKLHEAFLLVHEGLKGVSARLDHLPAAVRVELEQPAKRAEG